MWVFVLEEAGETTFQCLASVPYILRQAHLTWPRLSPAWRLYFTRRTLWWPNARDASRHLTSDFRGRKRRPNSSPNRDGLQPKSDGLQRKSNGLQPSTSYEPLTQ